MKSYYLKLNGREEGPFSESQIAQMFADGRADRSTACRASDQIQRRTIDEHLKQIRSGVRRWLAGK